MLIFGVSGNAIAVKHQINDPTNKEYSNLYNKRKEKTHELYFGGGGKYSTDQLKNRADMLDQTEAYVTLMKLDLKVLTYEIEKNRVRIGTSANN